ncbi:hypothetical protein AGMMS50256_01490 [Betaproteobacteria bacterium]|nr:hypothetical protein AGMMS50256_01490 [Betaproteobacteria bacterium]
MKYDLRWLIGDFEKKKRVKYIFFWGHQKSKNGDLTSSCFSQWWAAPFFVDNVKYSTAEHWMMAQKALLFEDADTYNKIISAKSPAEAKALGRQVSGFNEIIWKEKCFEIVVRGNLYKFTQHEDLKEFLLKTKDRVLVEASPLDKIWGIGLAADNEKIENPKLWKGLNLLGFALMEVRDTIKNRRAGPGNEGTAPTSASKAVSQDN